MHLIHGEIIQDEQLQAVLDNLESSLLETLSKPALDSDTVLSAVSRLKKKINQDFIKTLRELGIVLSEEEISLAKQLLSRKYLKTRLKSELPYHKAKTVKDPLTKLEVTYQSVPLGTLLHIVAGNQFSLALSSCLEGLLTGNINLVKLSSKDSQISALILKELIALEPLLKDYIYVFNISSRDSITMNRLIALSDGVVVYGGDKAISSLRQSVPVNTKLIEWGHKISFAYLDQDYRDEGFLYGLAYNIINTRQLLCSSCQGIYLNTLDDKELETFGRLFLSILEQTLRTQGQYPDELVAQSTLISYTAQLKGKNQVLRGEGVSVTIAKDNKLEASLMLGNPWVKPLLKKDILRVLKPCKSYLQTVAVGAKESRLSELSDLFVKAGAVRITDGRNMSALEYESIHDGKRALSRYTRLVSVRQK